MKALLPIAAFMMTLGTLGSCGKKARQTTQADSTSFPTLADKQTFLEHYVSFRRIYEDLSFDISYLDGGNGIVPGPTEWDIRLLAKVPQASLDEWVSGLASTPAPDLAWVFTIPGAPSKLASFEWYSDDARAVGISREHRLVLYRNRSE
ncbi:MAG: hypothetical protein EAZ65_08060 [Verrucomicrobia bacterium]|nr:MAG: hypothetical protein EAZ84_09425 [Verrucomicrobiota bacterium]TAE86831.1 MAG: hypothetical protein EAZ82_09850 [Verrucomicrobiota bacterium]TAF24604.1 MAG: hypothetical protein EAZ71_10075 [Verrucomicrobiota bacterium]TAF40504.1 MAG: hypothetical protein EAZ65_08060 [Verrucomicrobiota bacterium]